MTKEWIDGLTQEAKTKQWKKKVRGLGYDSQPCVSCTTFNILAPIYKRLDEEDQNCRESQYRANWLSRNQRIIDRLLADHSSIICLQEVWLGNDELVDMYENRLGDENYMSFKLARTNNRGDGLLTAVHRDNFRVLNYRELLFNDFGDRVAQLLHVESVVPFWQNQKRNIQQQSLIVNTHLLFPHDYSLCIVRLKQVYKILQYIESYQKENKLGPMPIILCGDWNGSKRGHVYKILRSQGFVSSYDTAHQYTDSDADAHKNLLRAASLSEDNAFALLKGDSPGDYITYSSFCQALCQLGLLRHPDCLSSQETEDLWIQADIDGNGVMNYEEFQQRIWNPKSSEQPEENFEQVNNARKTESGPVKKAFGFSVKDAVLFPPEMEKGMWPENYSLSDHAPLTVVFSPVRVPCTQLVC
ncbi:uncharacterized calcium-binding protein At1g02270-like isoform X4 [Typha latifolia]|uniref:uncharacterized calcium-binding protein At1g02270-like isoform X4 n=1 Tax=Typha latifolia TaxID=4733 RepID=UPI003C2DAE4B